MSDPVNWNDIPLFLAIADHGTLAGAARALGINHSTVFRRLAALEDAAGARLFDRLPTGYLLTAAGDTMLPLARAAEQSMRDIAREVIGHDTALSGPVRVTAPPKLARAILPAAVKSLRQDHPGIRVEIVVSDADYDLTRREADIALRATTAPPEHLVGLKLLDLPWSVCAPPAWRNKPRTLDDLAGHPLIGPEAGLTRLAVFRKLPVRDYVATANDISTMAALAAAGVGLCLLPADQQRPDLVRLFDVPGAAGELWLLTHPDLHRIPRVKAVWTAIRNACAAGLGD